MATKVFELEEGSMQHAFFMCRDEIAGYTGGYGNGKTAALGVLAINLATSYEKARILVGRATRPKLEDSTKPELLKWFPEEWAEQWPSERRNNLVIKETGSTIEFRHIRQEGKGKGEQQSNLLSATYDAIFVDQIDDPEFGFKDFADLVGRLRGTAKYLGDDPTMPRVGPQWLRFGANPTRNWLFRQVVNPYFIWKKSGLVTKDLLYDESTKKPIINIFNAPTSANKHNTGARYERRMQIVMRGSMAKRYIEGDWSAYDGLVYPDYDQTVHMVMHDELAKYLREQIQLGTVGVVEGYDYGQIVPSCYGLAFYDNDGNIFIADGFYEAQKTIKWQANRIKEIRDAWNIIPADRPYADPALFRGTGSTAEKVSEKVANLFAEQGIVLQRGANDVATGIDKISSYLAVDKYHKHPVTGVYGAPRLFVSSNLEWWHNEIVDYYWNKNIQGLNVDKPRDVNDHAMDMTKYLLTKQKKVIGVIQKLRSRQLDPRIHLWGPAPDTTSTTLPRHL